MRLNLPLRLLIPLLILFVIILGINSYFIKPALITHFADRETDNAELLNQSIADYSSISLQGDCNSELVNDLSQAQSSRHLAQISILVPNCGKDNLTGIDLNEFSNQPHLQKALSGEIYTNYQIFNNQLVIQVFTPIFDDNHIIGVISFEKIEENFFSGINNNFKLSNLILTLITISIAGYFYMITNSYSRSLKQINRDLQSFFNQSEDTKLSHRQDEIGILYKSLMNAIEKIKDQLQQISFTRDSLSNVIENIKDGIIIVDSSGHVVLVNHAAKDMFSVKCTKKNPTIMEAFRNHLLDEVWLKSHDNQETQFTSIENPSRHLYIECIATPLKSNTTNSTVLLLQDVTKLRQLENVRRTFVSNVSHELRTPLASLKAIIDTLQEGAVKDTRVRQKFLRLMDSEIDHLTHMVQELVELSKIESGQFPLQKQTVQANTLIENAIERMNLQVERAGLTISHAIETNLSPLSVDVSRIEQVLMNLIHNAIKFTKPGGKIYIHAKQENREIIFSVQDTGIGIPPNELERVFERFYKVDRSRTERGTGLGLSISRHIINAHGGKIWVESVLTQGSTFYFSLPI